MTWNKLALHARLPPVLCSRHVPWCKRFLRQAPLRCAALPNVLCSAVQVLAGWPTGPAMNSAWIFGWCDAPYQRLLQCIVPPAKGCADCAMVSRTCMLTFFREMREGWAFLVVSWSRGAVLPCRCLQHRARPPHS